MINRIYLKNFQGHQDSDFLLAPGINVVTGESDAGKSSLIRALFWAIKNRPIGAAEVFRNWLVEDKDTVSVTVELDGTHGIVRYRRGADNGYDVDGEKLKAIRTDVPSEVADLLNISDHNIQPQHDAYFLLADSPGDVARKLNEVCGLDIIDNCLKTANLLISRNGQEIKTSEATIAQTQADIDTYIDLEGREKALGILERKQGHLADARSNITTLEDLIADREALDIDLKAVDGLLVAETEVEALWAKVEEQNAVQERIDKLGSLINERTRLDKEIASKDAALGEMESSLENLMDGLDVCPLCLSTKESRRPSMHSLSKDHIH
jgi:exonuclease SbcC